ncbi:SCP domain-containing protein, partial [Haematococcus lacustris]
MHKAPPLAWDSQLARAAQQWADKLASTCTFRHANSISEGENLGKGFQSWGDCIFAWYSQQQDYDFQSPGFDLFTNAFTQL